MPKYPNSECDKHRNVQTSAAVCIVCMYEEIMRLRTQESRGNAMKYHGWPMDAEAAYLDLLGKLSAANARIAELEKAVAGFLRHCNEHERGWYSDGVAGLAVAYARATAPVQPSTLPESKQQK